MSEDHIDRIVDAIHDDYVDIMGRDNRIPTSHNVDSMFHAYHKAKLSKELICKALDLQQRGLKVNYALIHTPHLGWICNVCSQVNGTSSDLIGHKELLTKCCRCNTHTVLQERIS